MDRNSYDFLNQLRKVREMCKEISIWSKELGYVVRPFNIYTYAPKEEGDCGPIVGTTRRLLPRRPVSKDDLEFMMTYWNN